MSEKKCVIIAGGALNDLEFHKEIAVQADFLICADGGARHAKRMGLLPDLVIGDFDTLTERELEELCLAGVQLERYPREKDFTDTHLALLKALEMGYTQVDLLGCLGGRFDHAYANVMLLALPQGRNANMRILDETQEIILVTRTMVLEGERGNQVSLLPLSQVVTGIRTEGLLYQVPGGTFTMGVPNGISNVFAERRVSIEIGEGFLLVIRLREEKI